MAVLFDANTSAAPIVLTGPAGASIAGPPGQPGAPGPASTTPGPQGQPGAGTTANRVASAPIPAYTNVVDIGNNRCTPADPSNLNHCGKLVGIVTTATPMGGTAVVQTYGPIPNVTGTFFAGDPLFIAADGTLTNVPPTAGWRQNVATAATDHDIVYAPREASFILDNGIALVLTAGGFALPASPGEAADPTVTGKWIDPVGLAFAMSGKLDKATGGTVAGQLTIGSRLYSDITIVDPNPLFNLNVSESGFNSPNPYFAQTFIYNVNNPIGSNREAFHPEIRVSGGIAGIFYVAHSAVAHATLGAGEIFGGNFTAISSTNSDPSIGICGAEFNTNTPANVNNKTGINIVDTFGSNGRGTSIQGQDAGAWLFRQYRVGGTPADSSRGWEHAIQLGVLQSTGILQFPGVSSGIKFGYGSPAVGIDMRMLTPSLGVAISLKAGGQKVAFTTPLGGTLGDAGDIRSDVTTAGKGVHMVFAEGSKLVFQDGGVTQAMTFDMQSLLSDLPLDGQIRRVKVGASGSAAGGAGRELFVDN